jgi:hypothetical protein
MRAPPCTVNMQSARLRFASAFRSFEGCFDCLSVAITVIRCIY